MADEQQLLEKIYDPGSVEQEMYALWEKAGAFRSHPADPPVPHDKTFTIVIPPPNVTGALHLGHALNNTLQDILVRYHRMRGFNTLWQPGTDHAGIATQAVVERRIREHEGLTRHQIGREKLVERIWQWKDEYEKRILGQLQMLGCSCDWERNRFTLDDGLARAVRHMFFKLFKDGLIFRGKRLVNWDTQLQTAVSDDEVYRETVKGAFYYFKYPVIPSDQRRDHDQSRDRKGAVLQTAEPESVIIATTRPETMLGDVAVAVHPDPAGELDRRERKLREDLASESRASARAEMQASIDAISARRESHLPLLTTLSRMAKEGRKIRLPLVDRAIPLIADEWADPMLGTGCVKITPAHDPNDYQVGVRHSLPMINILSPDGKIARIVEADGSTNPNGAKYEGLEFTTAGRQKVVADIEAAGLLEKTEDRDIELSHSDRSKTAIEPYLSDQWFVKTDEIEGFEIAELEPREIDFSKSLLEAAAIPDRRAAKGLAEAAIRAVTEDRVQVFPQRYAKSYLDWLGEKRDWCISRQLWWGHRIPIWQRTFTFSDWMAFWKDHLMATDLLGGSRREAAIVTRAIRASGEVFAVSTGENGWEEFFRLKQSLPEGERVSWQVCVQSRDADGIGESDAVLVNYEDWLARNGFDQDPDVLDTWFSSALWPFSTLGWPEETPHLKQYYPGSVLVTSRDIITNWVARMVMFGLYAMGKVPFDHVYIHPKILDGRGETMSKSKGNGVDPIDIIHTHGADALRYTMADMTTETQDIRMPVEYVCPHCGKLTDQSIAIKNEEQARKSRGIKLDRKLQPSDCQRVRCAQDDCKKEFATQWADAALKKELGLARETSDKFDIGRNFCNKLWNAARFAFMNLEGATCDRLDIAKLPPEDRWILSRLSETIRKYHAAIQAYQFSASVKELRDFFWDSLCDWYIELTKPRLSGDAKTTGGATARQVLAFCLDQILRLWHPTIPFITERLWQQLNAIAPKRGLPGIADPKTDSPLILAEFPPVEGYPKLEDASVLKTFAELQDATRGVRELRNQCGVAPKDRVTTTIIVPADSLASFRREAHIVQHMGGIGELHVASAAKRPANSATMGVGGLRIYVHDISDDAADRTRTNKAIEALNKQIEGKQSKLGNEKFVANAKPEVVEAERTRLAEMLAERGSLQAHIAELDR